MKDRDYMLKVIWRSIPDHHTAYKWMDGSKTYFYKGLKIEDLDGKLELYTTVSSLYKIVPIHGVWYAYENGIEALSDSVKLTVYSDRVNNKKVMQAQQTIDSYNSRIEKLLKQGVINLNQIKEEYERQSTTSEVVQGV